MIPLTVRKAMHLLRTAGPRAMVTKAAQHTLGALCARRKLLKHPTFNSVDELIDFGFNTCWGVIRPIQIKSEIRRLLAMMQEMKPKRVMEIGTANGGTLFLFTRVAAPDAQLISLDLPGGQFGGGYPTWKRPLYKSFALPEQRIDLVQGDSHEPKSLDVVKSLTANQPLDFLLIDGDHRYDGVKKDFEMYAPLVRPGGLIAFHDVLVNQGDPTNEVWKFWAEIKQRFNGEDVVENPQQTWCGIGVVRVGDQPISPVA